MSSYNARDIVQWVRKIEEDIAKVNEDLETATGGEKERLEKNLQSLQEDLDHLDGEIEDIW